jgi:hypothetical protein
VLVGLAMAALLAGVLMLVLVVPRLLSPPLSAAELRAVSDPARRIELDNDRRKLQNDARTTLLQGLGGLAVLAGAYAAWRQLAAGREQLRVAQQGQITERFTRAIDQLGSPRLDVRLGGSYALERIAHDSPGDRATIEEVLTAFIRGHTPRSDSQAPPVPPKEGSGEGRAAFPGGSQRGLLLRRMYRRC